MTYTPKDWGNYEWDPEKSLAANLELARAANATIETSDMLRIDNGISDMYSGLGPLLSGITADWDDLDETFVYDLPVGVNVNLFMGSEYYCGSVTKYLPGSKLIPVSRVFNSPEFSNTYLLDTIGPKLNLFDEIPQFWTPTSPLNNDVYNLSIDRSTTDTMPPVYRFSPYSLTRAGGVSFDSDVVKPLSASSRLVSIDNGIVYIDINFEYVAPMTTPYVIGSIGSFMGNIGTFKPYSDVLTIPYYMSDDRIIITSDGEIVYLPGETPSGGTYSRLNASYPVSLKTA